MDYDYAEKSIGYWLGIRFIQSIPLVGLIVMIVWAASGDPNKTDFAKAALVQKAIFWAIALFWVIFNYASLISLNMSH